MSDFVKYTVYFLLGGTIVSVSTYLGSQGRSFLAAFASTFPAITGATFVLIYLNSGNDAIVSYAKNLLWFVPPWIGLRRGHDSGRPPIRLLALHDRLARAISGLRGSREAGGEIDLWSALALPHAQAAPLKWSRFISPRADTI